MRRSEEKSQTIDLDNQPRLMEATLQVCVALTDQSHIREDALANIHLTLMHAAVAGRVSLVAHLLDSGVPVDFAPRGLTALYAAISAGKEEMVAFLLDRGASTKSSRFGDANTYARSVQQPGIAESIEQRSMSSSSQGTENRRRGRTGGETSRHRSYP